MGVDEHMQATILSGIFDKLKGASHYLTDRCNPSTQVTRTFIVRAVTKKERLDLPTLLNHNTPTVPVKLPDATHVIVGIFYGAEAYCVLSRDIPFEDEEAREEAEQLLSQITTKMENALEDNQQVAEFKEQFDKEEKKLVLQLKCRLYADFQSQPVRECTVFDAYKYCLKLMDQVKSKSVPFSVVLCPLNVIFNSSKKMFEYRDVDAELISRCCAIWTKLDQVVCRAEALRNLSKNKKSLRLFIEAISKFQGLLKKSWQSSILKARLNEDGEDDDVERAASIAEKHNLFKISRLNRYLRLKESELEMAKKMASVNGITFLADMSQLEKELSDSFDKKFSLVLNVPLQEEKSNEMLDLMKEYVEGYNRLMPGEEEDDEDEDVPWHMEPRKRKHVLDKIREMAEHVEKNKQVQFFIVPDAKKLGYSVFKADNLLKDNADLPVPPTGLRIDAGRTKNPSIRLQWDYEDSDCTFLVEFRSKDDPDWKQQKTSKPGEKQTVIALGLNSSLEMRVAAETCIGRSDFSDVVDSDLMEESLATEDTSALKRNSQRAQLAIEDGPSAPKMEPARKRMVLHPPTQLEVEFQTQTTAELVWKPSAGCFSYFIRCWPNGQGPAQEVKTDSTQTSCRLEQLRPATCYSVNMVAVSEDGQESAPSETATFTTQSEQVRFAEVVLRRCKKIGSRNGMDLYGVPLVRSSGATAERYTFGKPEGRMQRRTILVMGATGSGKTTLINGLINFIFNVEWQDTFRFQLIQEAGGSQVDSQTSKITAYDIHHMEGFRIPYSLTIVDTPGYGDTKGLDRDQEITEMVRKFFEDKNGIQELDVVGFVAQASLPRLTPTQVYIFDSVLSIFGRDVKENINFLLTFADSQIPPVLSAIEEAGLPCSADADGKPLHHKFNNSGFFCSSRESGNTVDKFNRFFWKMGMTNFEKFFNKLATMKTKSLSLTKQVLEERKQLEATVEGLQPLIKTGLSKMEEMRKTELMIRNSEAQIEANENVEFEVEVTKPHRIEIPAGQYLTNCNKCYVTCHNPCAIPNDDGKVDCWAMDHSMPADIRACRVCPERCIWNLHANQPYRWEYVTEKQATSSDAIKEKYEKQLKRKLTAQDLVKVLKEDLDKNDRAVLDKVNTVSNCIKRLDEIALRPNPFSTPQYIDLIIDAEQQEKRLGFQERIESLKKLRQMAVITSKIKNNESLLDRRDDLASPAVDKEDDGLSSAEDDDFDGASLTSAAAGNRLLTAFNSLCRK